MKYQIDGQGIVSLPGSKSIAIRTLIIASFLKESLKILNFPLCDDCLTLMNALKELGFELKERDGSLTIHPAGKINLQPSISIKDSAAALRFLLIRLAGIAGLKATLSLSPQLAGRPHEPLLEIIRSTGSMVEKKDNVLLIHGTGSLSFSRKTESLIRQYASVSSQFISGILLSAPLFEKGLRIELPKKQVSHSYIGLTLDIMTTFGLKTGRVKNSLIIPSQEYVKPSYDGYRIEEDCSSACYLWAIGALSRKPVGVETGPSISRQPDFQFLKILHEMGALVCINSRLIKNGSTTELFPENKKPCPADNPDYSGSFTGLETGTRNRRYCLKRERNSITVQAGELHGLEVDMKEMPDQVPTLAVISLFADSRVKISNIGHLRYKESDRISALIRELSRIGAEIEYDNKSLIITPLKTDPRAAILNTYRDHRLVMAFSLLTLVFKEIRLDSHKAVDKSFPAFFDKLERIFERR